MGTRRRYGSAGIDSVFENRTGRYRVHRVALWSRLVLMFLHRLNTKSLASWLGLGLGLGLVATMVTTTTTVTATTTAAVTSNCSNSTSLPMSSGLVVSGDDGSVLSLAHPSSSSSPSPSPSSSLSPSLSSTSVFIFALLDSKRGKHPSHPVLSRRRCQR